MKRTFLLVCSVAALGVVAAWPSAFAADTSCLGTATAGLAEQGLTTKAIGVHANPDMSVKQVVKFLDGACAAGSSPAKAAAQLLKQAAYTPAQVGNALIGGFASNASEAAQIFKEIGYTATETGV